MGEHTHPEVTMHTYPLSEYMVYIKAGEWNKVAGLMVSSAGKVALAGADFAVCPDNTIHQAFTMVKSRSTIPWLHIAEAVGEEAKRRDFKCLGILGTKYLMTGPVYPDILTAFDITSEIPDEKDQDRINDIIFTQLVNGVFPEKSRLYFNDVIEKLRHRGCDAVVLGCTEIPLIVDPSECSLPTLDSTRLLARAAVREALKEG